MTANMKAALLVDYSRIESTTLSVPNIKDDDLLVRVVSVGVCGSDVAVFKGEHPYKKPPTVLGHEMCGVVERIGKNVTNFIPGDKVCCASYSYCGSCEYCSAKNYHICSNKKPLSHLDWHGAFAEYVLLKENMTYKINSDVEFHVGALVEPLTIGLHAVRLAMIANPNKLVILGAGSIGLSCLVLAKYLNVTNVLITDVGCIKANLADKFHADGFVDALGENFQSSIFNKLNGMADVTIIASGHENALDEAMAVTKSGGLIVIVSYFGESLQFDMNTCVRREMTIKGSALCTPQDFQDVIKWIEEKSIDPMSIITHFAALDDADKVIHQKIQNPESFGKIMLMLSDGQTNE